MSFRSRSFEVGSRTGYKSVRDRLRGLLGDEAIDRAEELWGTNAEGELRAGYKPSGQPGVNTFLDHIVEIMLTLCLKLWFAVGPSRFLSKSLVCRRFTIVMHNC